MSEEVKVGWELLHSQLPPKALKPLGQEVYGVAGLTDVNEGYLIQRLFASKLRWQWRLGEQHYLGSEDRKAQSGREYRVYLASAHGILEIDGREFHGAGASDNKKLDAAYKGAATVAFKNACKLAGLTIELFKDGKAMDFIYEDQGAGTSAGTPPSALNSSPAPAPSDGQGVGGSASLVGLDNKADPPPATKTPEQEIEYLHQLGASLPKRVASASQVDDEIAKDGLARVRTRLRAAHLAQCGLTCPHIEAA